MHVFLTLLILPATARPVAASTIAATSEITRRKAPVYAWNITGQIAANIAETLLRVKEPVDRLHMAPVNHTAQISAAPENRETH